MTQEGEPLQENIVADCAIEAGQAIFINNGVVTLANSPSSRWNAVAARSVKPGEEVLFFGRNILALFFGFSSGKSLQLDRKLRLRF